MRTFFALFFLLGTSFQVFSQQTSTDRQIGGFQLGVIDNNLGVTYYHEQMLTNAITLRGEAVLGFGWVNKSVVCGPVLAIQPRWYYNINKRKSLGIDVARNSANFLGLNVSYNLPFNLWYNSDLLQWESNTFKGQDRINLAANWGIRRAIGSRLNYEVGVGLGYRYYIDKDYRLSNPPLYLSLNLRLGFDIYK